MSSQTGFFLVATVEKRIHPQPKQVKVEEEGVRNFPRLAVNLLFLGRGTHQDPSKNGEGRGKAEARPDEEGEELLPVRQEAVLPPLLGAHLKLPIANNIN